MRLSDCGKEYKIADDYKIEITDGDYIVLIASAMYGSACAEFWHGNIAAKEKRVLEFKHYRRCGSKFWTAHPGFDFYFIVPKRNIELIPEQGHSYVPVKIGNRKYTLSVSGGSGDGCWTDWINKVASVGAGHTVKSMIPIADNAISAEEAAEHGFDIKKFLRNGETEEAKREQERFDRLAAEIEIRGKLKEGDSILLADGYSYGWDKKKGPLTISSKGRRKRYFDCRDENGRWWKVRYKEIDWIKTGELLKTPAVTA
jgi:hypothetical protein